MWGRGAFEKLAVIRISIQCPYSLTLQLYTQNSTHNFKGLIRFCFILHVLQSISPYPDSFTLYSSFSTLYNSTISNSQLFNLNSVLIKSLILHSPHLHSLLYIPVIFDSPLSDDAELYNFLTLNSTLLTYQLSVSIILYQLSCISATLYSFSAHCFDSTPKLYFLGLQFNILFSRTLDSTTLRSLAHYSSMFILKLFCLHVSIIQLIDFSTS